MKSGWASSEFWLRLLGKGLGLTIILLSMAQQTPMTQAIGTLCGSALAWLAQHGYSEQRTQLKLADIAARAAMGVAAAQKPADPPAPPPAS